MIVVICVIVRVSAVPVLLHWSVSENLQKCGMDGKSASSLQRAVSTYITGSGSAALHRSKGCFLKGGHSHSLNMRCACVCRKGPRH